MAEEEAAIAEVMNLFEAEPSCSCDVTSTASIVSGPHIPALCEQLAVLVSTGKAKEAIGVQFTHEKVKLLSDKDLEKYCKRYFFNSIFNQGI